MPHPSRHLLIQNLKLILSWSDPAQLWRARDMGTGKLVEVLPFPSNDKIDWVLWLEINSCLKLEQWIPNELYSLDLD